MGHYETIEEERHDSVALIRLNRPTKLNAMSRQLVGELRQTVAALRSDDSVRAVVFAGAGRAFSAGADIAELESLDSTTAFMNFIEEIQTTFGEVDDLPKPTIAALNGPAFGGGCELSLSCDFRIMAEDGVIGVPEVRIGVLPGAGGTQRLPRLLPPAIARQMIYLGEPLDAAAAVRFGLANAAVPKDKVIDTALEWAARLAKLPPLAIRVAKPLVRTALNADIKTGNEHERHAMAYLFDTDDRREGMRAFLERREGTFTGR